MDIDSTAGQLVYRFKQLMGMHANAQIFEPNFCQCEYEMLIKWMEIHLVISKCFTVNSNCLVPTICPTIWEYALWNSILSFLFWTTWRRNNRYHECEYNMSTVVACEMDWLILSYIWFLHKCCLNLEVMEPTQNVELQVIFLLIHWVFIHLYFAVVDLFPYCVKDVGISFHKQ